jgi:hypothetical protein
MALLYFPDRALDDSGDPMPFALLYTRDNAAHSTPKPTYTAAALTVPNTNPLVADDAGYFPQMYAEEAEEFYLILTASGGDPSAPYRAYGDVTALGGSGTGTFERAFPDSRWAVDSGDTGGGGLGTVIGYGSASPTDTGGYVLEQGWAGTQGTKKVVDFATVEVTGALNIDGAVVGGGAITAAGALISTSGDVTLEGVLNAVPRCTSRGTATNAATTDLSLDSGYEAWEIHIRNYQVLGVSGGTPSMRLSFDGSTFKSASGDYSYGSLGVSGTTVAAAAWAATATYIPVGNANSGPSGTGGGGETIIRITSSASHETHYRVDYHHYSVATSADRSSGWVTGSTPVKSYGKAAKVRIFDIAGGNLTFDYVVIGLP